MARAIRSTRCSVRSEVSVPARCLTAWGRIEAIMLTDVSAQGCCITATHKPLDRGARVIIRTAALLGASGVVRWTENLSAGVEFDSPLPASILQHLANIRSGGASLIIPNQTESPGKRSLQHV